MRRARATFVLAVLLHLAGAAPGVGQPTEYAVGVAQVDVTPAYPVRLSGFGFRRTESEGVTQRIWAKALAVSAPGDEPAVLLAVDNCGIPAWLTEEVAARLQKKAGVKRDRVAVTATHTHTAPMLKGNLPTLFGVPIPKEHLERIDRYTAELTDKMEQAALAALADRQPARLTWGVGKAGFAINRRTKGGPVDHDLPVLVVRDLKGKLRAVYLNYACHCVTLSNNKVSGDWAGYAMQHLQDRNPGVVALVSVGCGADSNPSSGVTGDKVEVASRQGKEVADEVQRLLGNFLAPVSGKLTTARHSLDLPLDDLPTREQWEEKGKRTDAIGFHARLQLERLGRGEKLKTNIPYPVQTWKFGPSLAMVFLPGEVVVDYALRLKRELDGHRLWLNAYANDCPAYIPSERILREGGYEGAGAMVYYDVPARFKSGLEQRIIDAVKEQLGPTFHATFDPGKTRTRPLSPQQSLAEMRIKPELVVELVASEPLVTSPVAIDFGPDGRMWVCEMADYPMGPKGDYQPGGRVRVLEDTDGDGRYDKSTVFLDNIPFPTGVTAWRDGVLVCAAPDILYAEDTQGTGKADVVKKLLSGFGTHNFQARVNSLEIGLDCWVYGSCGLFGGKIKSFNGKEYNLGDRDFRFKPDTGELEPTTGRTQQGKARDDWGNWFGCDNSNLCRHYPLDDRYLRRNPHVLQPDTAVHVPDPEANKLYPLTRVQLFPLSGNAGQATAACGLGIYRDNLLGPEYANNAFVCEPVNLVVHRMILEPRGSTFVGRRAKDEANAEFLATTDNWSRFVQARTGPDGALYIVDMYRYVIEHPIWIPKEEVAQLDVRAGATMGRIYRVRPKDRALRPVPRLDQLIQPQLVEALDSPNGWQRDMAGSLLLLRSGAVQAALAQRAQKGSPEARLHALGLLDRLGFLIPNQVVQGLQDKHPGVRRFAASLAARHLMHDAVVNELLRLVQDGDAQVRLQVAYTLGEWQDRRAAPALAMLATRYGDDPHLAAALLSSIHRGNVRDVLTEVFAEQVPPDGMTQRLLGTAVAVGGAETVARAVEQTTVLARKRPLVWQMTAFTGILDALDRGGQRLDGVADDTTVRMAAGLFAKARTVAADERAPAAERLAATRLLGREKSQQAEDVTLLGKLLVPQNAAALQNAAVTSLGRVADDRVVAVLLEDWKTHSPDLKTQILDLLLSRPAWQRQLLAALEKKDIPASQLDAARRQRLLRHRDAAIRDRAERLFAGGTSPDRQKVLETYRTAATKPGDRAHGQAVFAKSCAPCHRIQNVGFAVGPDLTALTGKSTEFMLTAILDPGKDVDARYVEYVAATKSGQTFNGILAAETATGITLRGQEGKQQVLLRNELDALASTGRSMMPEGIEKDINPQDMADLLAYLMGTTKPPRRFPGNNPVLTKTVNGALHLPATACEIYGVDIVFEQDFKNIGFWHGVEDHVAWSAEADRDGEFDVYLDYACANDSAGNAFLFEGARPALRGRVAGTGGWDRYTQTMIGTVTLAAGLHRLSFRAEGPGLNRALADLRGIYLVPRGQKLTLVALAPADPRELARQILDDKLPPAKRQALVADNPTLAPELVAALTADLQPGTPEEYRRIPWIWRVAVASGRRNDAEQLRKLLDVSLPKPGEPLRDWQAVVLGGGVINGISLEGQWPGQRLDAILKDSPGLKERFARSLTLAAPMADDEKVPTGTRYDALRMIPLEGWEKRGEQLKRYMAKGVHPELQQGAISGLADLDAPPVAALLLSGMEYYSPGNRNFAVGALLRTEGRTTALVEALEKGNVKPGQLGEAQKKALRELKDEKLRARAVKALAP